MKPTSKIIAIAALVAFIGTASVFTEAAPVNGDLKFHDFSSGPNHVQEGAMLLHDLRKRAPPATETTGGKLPDTATKTTVAPHTTTEKPKTANPTADPAKSSNPPAHATTSSAAAGKAPSSAAVPVGPTGSDVPPLPSGTSSPGSGGSSESSVPTAVSEKVFIGLGTVGGFIVFALGGVAFCRHRKKKNLASALLQQTAQFNNNNPYAKLPEPAPAPKEAMAMTPTKPLGTYNVVATYTPALADEIEIGLGDSVTILQEYDDGWCMGVNNSKGGVKGVFPRHCVEMGAYEGSQHGAPGGPHYPPSPSFKAAANKRMSSIPQGWNDGYGGNYPPQSSPQYPPYQQGGGGGYGGGF
ncbi:hypothetical protein EMPS_08199 [Entomortierella parvispora]|uniref:SH3 domain-containing protein n=1 Tax=Entomortierella parvispora TaxID=205924 RepID=A0A9P3HFW4_9FUNG|nr:hypothetical protein EMPS_08199 [Entomortierella parvispora]